MLRYGGEMISKYKTLFLLIFIVFISLYLISCSAREEVTKKEEKGSMEEQTDKDILKLLGVEEKKEKGDTGDLANKVSELEKMVLEKNSEINELKSELVLKDERIDALQSKLKSSESKTVTISDRVSAEEYVRRYQVALGNYYSQNYREAIKQFTELLSIDMNTDLSDNCQYWIGECYYALKDFKKAIVEFEKVFTFSKNNKEDDAQLKLGLCYINLRDNDRARSELNRLITNYPKSEYIPKAKGLLNNL